jgi:hypothetical protein
MAFVVHLSLLQDKAITGTVWPDGLPYGVIVVGGTTNGTQTDLTETTQLTVVRFGATFTYIGQRC